MRSAQHHLYQRKLQAYPHPTAFGRFIDYMVLLVSIVGPAFSLPQLLTVWRDRATDGLSMTTWGSYLAFSIIWFTYGVVHKEKLVILGEGTFMVVNFLIVLGIILF